MSVAAPAPATTAQPDDTRRLAHLVTGWLGDTRTWGIHVIDATTSEVLSSGSSFTAMTAWARENGVRITKTIRVDQR